MSRKAQSREPMRFIANLLEEEFMGRNDDRAIAGWAQWLHKVLMRSMSRGLSGANLGERALARNARCGLFYNLLSMKDCQTVDATLRRLRRLIGVLTILQPFLSAAPAQEKKATASSPKDVKACCGAANQARQKRISKRADVK